MTSIVDFQAIGLALAGSEENSERVDLMKRKLIFIVKYMHSCPPPLCWGFDADTESTPDSASVKRRKRRRKRIKRCID